jgi:hypothetical protein
MMFELRLLGFMCYTLTTIPLIIVYNDGVGDNGLLMNTREGLKGS